MAGHTFHIFVDGAQKEGTGAASGFITTSTYIIISWGNYFGSSPSAEYSKARAIFEAILKCHQLNLNNACILTDSQLLWDKFTNLVVPCRYHWGCLFETSSSLIQSMNISFVKSPRTLNRVVDKLVKKALSARYSQVWWANAAFVPNLCNCLGLYRSYFEKKIM